MPPVVKWKLEVGIIVIRRAVHVPFITAIPSDPEILTIGFGGIVMIVFDEIVGITLSTPKLLEAMMPDNGFGFGVVPLFVEICLASVAG